jgi:hypothetical protein
MLLDTVELFARSRRASDISKLIEKSCDAFTRFQKCSSSTTSKRDADAATTNADAGVASITESSPTVSPASSIATGSLVVSSRCTLSRPERIMYM